MVDAASASKPQTAPHPHHRDPEVVRKAEAIFASMGMTPEDAISIFYKQTTLHGDFPITELIPNEKTQEVVRKARAGIGIIRYGSVDEMMAEFDDARANPHNQV